MDILNRNNILKEKLIFLNEDEINLLNKSYQYHQYKKYFKKYNNNIYHCKNIIHNELEFFVNELIGQIVSRYFNLPIKKSTIYMDDIYYYLLTGNFIEENKCYKNVSDDIFPKIYFYGICPSRLSIDNLNNFNYIRETSGEEIKKTDREDLKKFLYQLKAMIIGDFIRNQKDRLCRNFMIEICGNHVKLCPLYDFEHSFLIVRKYAVEENVFDFNIEDKKICKYVRRDDDFQKLLYMAMDINFNNIIEELYDEYGIVLTDEEKKDYMNVINDNKNRIKKHKLII